MRIDSTVAFPRGYRRTLAGISIDSSNSRVSSLIVYSRYFLAVGSNRHGPGAQAADRNRHNGCACPDEVPTLGKGKDPRVINMHGLKWPGLGEIRLKLESQGGHKVYRLLQV